jgi:hypothetical protein
LEQQWRECINDDVETLVAKMAWEGVEEVHLNLYRAVERRRGHHGGELHEEGGSACCLCSLWLLHEVEGKEKRENRKRRKGKEKGKEKNGEKIQT